MERGAPILRATGAPSKNHAAADAANAMVDAGGEWAKERDTPTGISISGDGKGQCAALDSSARVEDAGKILSSQGATADSGMAGTVHLSSAAGA